MSRVKMIRISRRSWMEFCTQLHPKRNLQLTENTSRAGNCHRLFSAAFVRSSRTESGQGYLLKMEHEGYAFLALMAWWVDHLLVPVVFTLLGAGITLVVT